MLKALFDACPRRLFIGEDTLKGVDEHKPVFLVKKQKVVMIMMKCRIMPEYFILVVG